MLAAIAFCKTHDLDELSDLAVPAYPDAEPLLCTSVGIEWRVRIGVWANKLDVTVGYA